MSEKRIGIAPNTQLPTHVEPLALVVDADGRERTLLSKMQRALNGIFTTPEQIAWLAEMSKEPENTHLPYLLSSDYEPLWLRSNTRKVFFDIEYTADQNDQYRFGLGVSIDESGAVGYWAENNAIDLVDYLLSFDEVVSFGGLTADNRLLAAQIPLSHAQALYNRTLDLQAYTRALSPVRLKYRPKLDTVAKRLLGRGKFDLEETEINHPSQIPQILRSGNTELTSLIWKYCLDDTQLLVDLYRISNIGLNTKLVALRKQIESIAERLDELYVPVIAWQTEEDANGNEVGIYEPGEEPIFGEETGIFTKTLINTQLMIEREE